MLHSRQRQRIFAFYKALRHALWDPTQHPIQWVLAVVFSGVKWLGVSERSVSTAVQPDLYAFTRISLNYLNIYISQAER